MSGKYAPETSVSVENSRLEIERTLKRYGADAFGYSIDGAQARVAFRIAGRSIRFVLFLPDPGAREFTHHSRGARDADGAQRAWEQACRQKWRALNLIVKAKLEAVSAGVTTIEDEFLAQTMTSDGRTVSETIQLQVAEHYRVGGPPRLMLEPPR